MIILKRFFPLIIATVFLANSVFSQTNGTPATWPDEAFKTSKPDAPAWEEPGARVDWSYLKTNRDTTIDGWKIRFLSEPQGTIGWQWEYVFFEGVNFTTVYYDKEGRCLNATFFSKKKPGDMYSIFVVPCLGLPVDFEKLKKAKNNP